MGTFTVIYDASVLYPAPLRDLLMHLAATGRFRACWTNAIHEEWIASLLQKRRDLSRDRLERTRNLMNAAVPDCIIEDYEHLIAGLTLPDPGDRHVLAAAIHAGAEVIVTANLGDFPSSKLAPHDIEAQHPDDFVCNLIELAPSPVCRAARLHRASLKHPPKSLDAYLDTLLRQSLPRTVSALRGYGGVI